MTERNVTQIFGNISVASSVFVSVSGDIYVDNGGYYGQINRWSPNTTAFETAKYVSSYCAGLFLDINNDVYCSLVYMNQVVKGSITTDPYDVSTIAGIGCSSSTPKGLSQPRGIFVDTNLDLYVADYGNNRIQLFKPGFINGTTVAGRGMSGSIILNNPGDVVLDGNGYMFISDAGNHRIIGSYQNQFWCVVGCSAGNGGSSQQLNVVLGIKFDSYGNIFAIDAGNNQLQKFLLSSNSCGESSSNKRSIFM